MDTRLKDVLMYVPECERHHVLAGAYVILRGDYGALYDRWKQLNGAKDSPSSHESKVPTKRIMLDGSGELVFGIRGSDTWVQLENASVHRRCCTHFCDYLYYVCSRRNVGLGGRTSGYTETNPLVIRYSYV